MSNFTKESKQFLSWKESGIGGPPLHIEKVLNSVSNVHKIQQALPSIQNLRKIVPSMKISENWKPTEMTLSNQLVETEHEDDINPPWKLKRTFKANKKSPSALKGRLHRLKQGQGFC